MTDLERHWEELPVGPAPVDAIMRRARAAAGDREPTGRTGASLKRVGVLACVAAAFVACTLVAQQDSGSGGSTRTPASEPAEGAAITPAAFHGELQRPESCERLVDHYVSRAVDLVGRHGWSSPYSELGNLHAAFDGVRANTERLSGYAGYAKTTGARASETGTNVQEQGVDEPDTVKTDGELLVRLRGAELTTYDVSGDAVAELGRLDLGDFHDGEILLVGDTVVALGNDGTRAPSDPYGDYEQEPSPQTRVLTVDIGEPTEPALLRTVDYDAALLAARQHDDTVRLTLSKGLPDLDFARGRGAARANRELVENTTVADWLPRVSVDGSEPSGFLRCARVAVPRAEIGLATTAVVGFTADDPAGLEALAVAGDAPLTYESADHLYLASTGGPDFFCRGFCSFDGVSGAVDGTTHVYAFSLDGTGASYLGAGEVEGTVRDRWSMDESDGVLRLAVGPSSETGNFNSIVTLRAAGDELVEVGRIDRLGVGEDIKSVRWFDGLALLVTFRQVDPLYAVDLTTPRSPRLLGELKIPGFSSYLHPLGPMRVVGVGTGPQPGGGSGAQLGLFDVTDLSALRRLDVHSYGAGTRARAGDDPRQFTWLPEQRTMLTVTSRGRTGYVSTVSIDGGRLGNEQTQVEYGDDIEQVRLVPLPDGKVVLVTGEDVEFFPLD